MACVKGVDGFDQARLRLLLPLAALAATAAVLLLATAVWLDAYGAQQCAAGWLVGW